MSFGSIILIVLGGLIIFGVGQRALDRLRLNDKLALLFIALIVGLGFVPDIPLGGRVSVNLGGCVVPVVLCGYLFVRAGSWMERGRALAAALVTGVLVYLAGRYMPEEPEDMLIDPVYLMAILAGITAYVFGRSRRAAFIAGVLGVIAADVMSASVAWSAGLDQPIRLGGAGAYDTVVIAGIFAVMLAELIGEAVERIRRGKNRPVREYSIENGEFLRREGDR